MQLFLFDDLPHEHVEEEDGKVCEKCGIRKKWELFPFRNGQVGSWLKSGALSLIEGVLEDKKYYTKYCKKCRAKDSKIIATLRRKAPPVPECCDCCGVSFESLNPRLIAVNGDKGTGISYCLDHCHDTNMFRGWLCTICNTSIGGLGDTLEGLNKAIAYLEKFERNKDV